MMTCLSDESVQGDCEGDYQTHRDVYVLTPFHYVPQLNSTTTHIAHIKDNVAIMHRF